MQDGCRCKAALEGVVCVVQLSGRVRLRVCASLCVCGCVSLCVSMHMWLGVCVRVCVCECVSYGSCSLSGHSAPQAMGCVWQGKDPPPGWREGEEVEREGGKGGRGSPLPRLQAAHLIAGLSSLSTTKLPLLDSTTPAVPAPRYSTSPVTWPRDTTELGGTFS